MIAPTDPEAAKQAVRRAQAAWAAVSNRHATALAEVERIARQAVTSTGPDDLDSFVCDLPNQPALDVAVLAIYKDALAAVAAELTAALPAALRIEARATAADELVARIQVETTELVRQHNAALCSTGE